MGWMQRLANTIRSGRVERDIRREVAFHIAERADELRAEGLSDEEAARHARAAFGNPTLQAERTRDADVTRIADTVLRDVRYAVRTLYRTPGFTVAAIATLALGIGANTAVFSALDTVLFRPLPFPDADRLVDVRQLQEGRTESFIAPPRLSDWSRLNSSFEAITGYYMDDVSETSGDFPERVRRAFVTPGFVEVWGVAPAIGRGFNAEEHRFGGPSAIVISERFWRTRMAADPHVLQRQVRLGGGAVPIVGVMPSTFRFPDRNVDLWSPSQVDAPYAQSREATWYTAVGRLRPGVTASQAQADLRAVQDGLAAIYPDTDRGVGVAVVPLKERTVAGAGASLWLLFGAVTVLLVIACTNIAALLLARAAHRRHEIAVRVSLGASRLAVAAQLLTETAVLAIAAGGAGLIVAYGATLALKRAAADLPRIDEMAIDARVLLYTLACTLAVAFLCGILPAFRTASGAAARGGQLRTQVSTRSPIQWILVGAQVALSVTLLTIAGLLARSFLELSRVDPGFQTDRILTFRVSGSWAETSDYPRLLQRIDSSIDALAALPGVEAAATTGWALPGVPEQWESRFDIAEASGAGVPSIVAEGRSVSPEYFATMGIPLVAGEPCRRTTGGDPQDPEQPVMVNRALVDRFLSDRPSAIGLHLRDVSGAQARPAGRISGIVGNARERGLDRDPGPTVYWCSSAPNPTPYFLVRTAGDPRSSVQDVRLTMKAIEPLRSVYEIAPLEERLGDAFAENRLRTALLALFAASALSLSIVGLYGTLSYVVSQRRREVGLRLALGAGRGRIVSHFALLGMRVVGLACATGLGLALIASRTLGGMLFGVTPSDPITFGAVLAIVGGATALAVLLPATRAAWLEPMRVLREQ